MAGIAVFSSKNPVSQGWLPEFIRIVDEEARVAWASSVGVMLKQVPTEKREQVWGDWIKAYWEKRRDGSPFLLSGAEVEVMARWLLHLDSAFPEAVEMFLGSPKPIPKARPSNAFLFMELKDSGLATRFPGSLAKFLLRLTESESTFPPVDFIDEMIRSLIPTAASRKVLLDICKRLAVLGAPGAAQLKHLVEISRTDESL